MTTTPDVITRYFAAAAKSNTNALLDCFTDDAWVIDEGRKYEGKDAIRGWREGTSSAYTYTLELRGVDETGPQEYTADTHLEGDFPGGVVDLPQVFGLDGEHIAHLHI